MTDITREQLVEAYCDMVRRRENAGFDGYILTLKFNQLAGSPAAVARIMERETENTFGRLLMRFIKKPGRLPIDNMPFLLACPDWPVPKFGKTVDLADTLINDGRHIQGIFMVPPVTRANCCLVRLLADKQAHFAGPTKLLQSLHAEPMVRTFGIATAYVLKSLTRHRVSPEDVIVLPRTHGEMATRDRGEAGAKAPA